ncbi:hypothetical protein [Agromyces neolithicus]|uniref:Uncharacterized protein n=1 Tax=Agromyces neolithicus TaxID=269420 RepID=A0ABN2LWW8_9MICO
MAAWRVDIPGAVKKEYRVCATDVGHALTVVVTATFNGLQPGTATSAPVQPTKRSTQR